MPEEDRLESILQSFFKRWFREHGRSFPWRQAHVSPFGLLLAELLLRQTRAEMAAPVWQNLVERCPDPPSLLELPPGELQNILQPLGLSIQRRDALRAASQAILARHSGRVPRSIEALRQLPHVGLYASNAVGCFAFHWQVPVVDVNVMRVLARLRGEPVPRDNRRAPKYWEFAGAILPGRGAREHNFGLLDFAAQICTARSPACNICPLAPYCVTAMLPRGDRNAARRQDPHETINDRQLTHQ